MKIKLLALCLCLLGASAGRCLCPYGTMLVVAGTALCSLMPEGKQRYLCYGGVAAAGSAAALHTIPPSKENMLTAATAIGAFGVCSRLRAAAKTPCRLIIGAALAEYSLYPMSITARLTEVAGASAYLACGTLPESYSRLCRLTVASGELATAYLLYQKPPASHSPASEEDTAFESAAE